MSDTECLPQFDGGCDLHKENAQLRAAVNELTGQLDTAERQNAELNQLLEAAGITRVPDCANARTQQEQRKAAEC